MPELSSIIKKFKNVKVLVVGDIMLDRYYWGSVERISPEAPVPIVKLEKNNLVVGGAANVAANISGLGAKAFLVGIIGKDEESKLFKPLLDNLNISSDGLVKISGRPTTIKTRVVAHSQHVVRIDQETNESLNVEQEKLVWKKIETLLEKIDLIIISDYAKGMLTDNLLARLITTGKALDKKILVDPKGKFYEKYSGAYLLTPNRFEAANACNLSNDDKNIAEKAGKLLINDLDVKSVLITQGEHGMTLFRKEHKPFHLNALARKVYDVTGAGDTVIASLGVTLGSGESLEKAAEIANIAAGIVVEEIGTTIITQKKLREFI